MCLLGFLAVTLNVGPWRLVERQMICFTSRTNASRPLLYVTPLHPLIFQAYPRQIEGRAKKSWVADSMLDETGQLIDGEDSHTLMISAGSLYAAGIDTASIMVNDAMLKN